LVERFRRAAHVCAIRRAITFVALRNGGAMLILTLVALALRSPWPQQWTERIGLMWAGALFQGFYLMALYWAIFHGLPVAIAALIAGLQPAFTAVFAAMLLGEKLSVGQTSGIALGLCGVGLVLSPKLTTNGAGTTLGLALMSLAGVAGGAYGSVYQKRFEHVGDDWSRTALLFVGAFLPAAVLALAMDERPIEWSGNLIAVYLWSVVPLAIGGTMGLLYLIRKGQAARAAALLYLVPPISALMAYVGFGERIVLMQVAGFAVVAAGVVQAQQVEARKET
jgi:drug/metabolite transporter (DMT)-like permease